MATHRDRSERSLPPVRRLARRCDVRRDPVRDRVRGHWPLDSRRRGLRSISGAEEGIGVRRPQYQLVFEREYVAQLNELEGRAGSLGTLLERSIYHILRRTPHEGAHNERLDMWIIRRMVLKPL